MEVNWGRSGRERRLDDVRVRRRLGLEFREDVAVHVRGVADSEHPVRDDVIRTRRGEPKQEEQWTRSWRFEGVDGNPGHLREHSRTDSCPEQDEREEDSREDGSGGRHRSADDGGD